MKKLETKHPKDSQIEMREMVMPNHTNAQGTIFGGQVMSWVDIAAAMCAARHAERPVVTVHVSDIVFKAPIKLGSHVIIKASLNYVGKTSMIVGVSVESENPYTGKRLQTTKAYLTFVALDEDGMPTPVGNLVPETEEEKRRYENAKKRVESRKALMKSLK